MSKPYGLPGLTGMGSCRKKETKKEHAMGVG